MYCSGTTTLFGSPFTVTFKVYVPWLVAGSTV